MSLVERANDFDSLMGDVADAIERGDDPYIALEDNGITEVAEREILGETIGTMLRLHSEGRDHIWAYYTRNLVRPVALNRSKVDVIVGNPPWLNYNQTASALRTELRSQSENLYDIWVGGRYATHSGRGGAVLRAERGPVSEGRRRNRDGDASQRAPDGTVPQVADGTLEIRATDT